ncbi:DUF2142 domain-containing protein [Geitlerinema sp. PCC 9228]|jgi:uncharacterized membrane protein|uniref:DUF2142 domain-containing protein n=1 Tax=Geitlerinema sp. PCC 9228 TaxID=111611 RepID=UPI0008F9C46A|nr:DUF2142 domain-containing protein [Geitlerinema sp. PCC 9228]
MAIWKVPEKAFLWIGGVFGALLVLLTPPFQVPDEYQHFYRAYQLSEGQILADYHVGECSGYTRDRQDIPCSGGYLPRSLLVTVREVSPPNLRGSAQVKQNPQDILALLDLPLQPSDRVFVRFQGAALYSPVPYLPQIVGIAVGRILGASPLILFYLGRFCNLLAWLGLGYLAIARSPIFAWLLALLLLMPMSLFQAASLSADAATNGLVFLLTATFLQYSLAKPSTSDRDLWFLGMLVLALPLVKPAYIPLVLLFFLIPASQVNRNPSSNSPPIPWRSKYTLVGGGMVLASVLTMLVWSSLAGGNYGKIYPSIRPEEQILFVLQHPVEYVGIFLQTLQTFGGSYLVEFVGKLGWLDTVLPWGVTISYWVILLVVALTDGSESTVAIAGWQKWLLGWVWLASSGLIFTLIYAAGSPVGANVIGGVQGRYFIAIAPLLFLLFYNRRLRLPSPQFSTALVFYLLVVQTMTIATVVRRYYWG